MINEILLTVESLNPKYAKYPFLLRLTSGDGWQNHYGFDHEPTEEERERCVRYFSQLLTRLQ